MNILSILSLILLIASVCLLKFSVTRLSNWMKTSWFKALECGWLICWAYIKAKIAPQTPNTVIMVCINILYVTILENVDSCSGFVMAAISSI